MFRKEFFMIFAKVYAGLAAVLFFLILAFGIYILSLFDEITLVHVLSLLLISFGTPMIFVAPIWINVFVFLHIKHLEGINENLNEIKIQKSIEAKIQQNNQAKIIDVERKIFSASTPIDKLISATIIDNGKTYNLFESHSVALLECKLEKTKIKRGQHLSIRLQDDRIAIVSSSNLLGFIPSGSTEKLCRKCLSEDLPMIARVEHDELENIVIGFYQ